MLAIALFALLALIVRVESERIVAHTVGAFDLPIRIRVLDARTRAPLVNAWVRKKDPDFPEPAAALELSTNELGEAVITETRIVYGVVRTKGRITERFNYPMWGLQVGKEGYTTSGIPSLRDRLGTSGNPANAGQKSPTIIIMLEQTGPGN